MCCQNPCSSLNSYWQLRLPQSRSLSAESTVRSRRCAPRLFWYVNIHSAGCKTCVFFATPPLLSHRFNASITEAMPANQPSDQQLLDKLRQHMAWRRQAVASQQQQSSTRTGRSGGSSTDRASSPVRDSGAGIAAGTRLDAETLQICMNNMYQAGQMATSYAPPPPRQTVPRDQRQTLINAYLQGWNSTHGT